MSAKEMQLAKVEDAPLPATYEAARTALAQCERVDECWAWADKASALASYARQIDDKSLEEMAVRIRARAVDRAGKLLKQIPAKAGRRGSGPGGDTPPELDRERSERAQAATAAGLSPDQTKQAIRIANIPAEEFEALIEAENPPTLTELAERGTRKKAQPLVDLQGRDPEEYNKALLFRGALRDLADSARALPPDTVFRGSVPQHYEPMRDNSEFIVGWLKKLLSILEKAK
jgi:hypothetical protein